MSELIQHSAWVERLARCLVRDPEAAEELVQETWLRAIKSPPHSLSSTRSRRAFLGRVVRNLMLQNAREQRHRRKREESYAVHEALPDTAELVAAIDSQRALVEEVLGLPDAQRDTLLLRYFHDLSSAEIARRTGHSPATVRSRLKRGLEELRVRLDRKAGGDAKPQLMALILAAPSATLSPLVPSATAPLSLSALVMSKLHAIVAVAVLLALGVAGIYQLKIDRSTAGVDAAPVAAADLIEGEHATELVQRDTATEEPRMAQPKDPVLARAPRQSAGTVDRGATTSTPETGLRGRVLDLDGNPVADATVWCGPPITVEGDDAKRLQRSGPRHSEEPNVRAAADPAETLQTDARGRFQFDDLPRGTYTVWAHRRDSRYGWATPVSAPSADAVEIRLEVLPRERRIAGVVQDALGRPYPDADLTYSVVHASGGARSAGVAVDEQGRFDIEVLLPSAHDLVANDPDADPARPMRAYANGVEPGTVDLVLRLGEASILNLQVHGANGVPIEDVRVMPMIGDGRSMVSIGSYGGPHAGGLVELPLPGREFELTLRAPGFRELNLGPLNPADVNGVLDVEMERAPEVSGVVLAGGVPVAGARVALYLPSTPGMKVQIDGYVVNFEREGQSAVTGADGRFVLFHQHGGAYRAVAQHEEYAAADSGPLGLDPDENRRGLVLELGAGGTLHVHAPKGTPEGETVVVHRGIGSARRATVGASGVATFENLTPGAGSRGWRMRRCVRCAARCRSPRASARRRRSCLGTARSARERSRRWSCDRYGRGGCSYE